MNVLERPLILIGALVVTALLLTSTIVYTFSAEIKFGGSILLMILLGSISRIPQRFAGGDIGIELIMLFTVCASVSVGTHYAVLIGTAAMGLSWFFTRERPDDVLIGVLGFGIVAFVSFFFGYADIVLLGVLMTLLYDVVICSVYVFTGHTPVGCVKFALTHVVWNFVMFRSFSSYVLAFLV